MSSGFSFPVHKVTRLVELLKDTHPELNVKEVDFRNPTSERWIQIDLYFLKNLLGVTHTMLAQPTQLKQYPFEFPEIHESAVFKYMLAIAMQRLALMCEVEDFTFRDISNPTTIKCTYMMSALVNFSNFFDGRFQVFEQIKAANEEVIKERQSKLGRIEESKLKIEHIKQSRLKIREETKVYQNQQEIHANELTEKKQESNERHKKCSEIKKRFAAAEASNATVKENIAVKKQEIDRISRLIVQSPERKKNEMEHSAKQLSIIKVEQEQRQRRSVELTNQLTQKEAQQERSDRVFKLFQQIQSITTKEKEGRIAISKMLQTQDLTNEQYQDLETRVMQLQRHITAKQDKMNKMVLQAENKQRSMMEARELMVRECKHIEESQSEETQLKHEIEQKIRKVQQAESLSNEECENEISQCREKYDSLMHSVDEYNKKLNQGHEKIHQQIRKGHNSDG